MAVKVLRIDGLKEAIDKFRNTLPKKTVAASLRKGIRAGQKIITATAKGMAPRKTGALSAAIKTRAIKRSRNYVGLKTTVGESWFQGEQFYGAFQEFGWKSGNRRMSLENLIRAGAKQLRDESRSIRVASGGSRGLAKKGTEFRARQERYFRQESYRRLFAKDSKPHERRQIPGKHFLERAANTVGDAAGMIMVARAKFELEQSAAKNG